MLWLLSIVVGVLATALPIAIVVSIDAGRTGAPRRSLDLVERLGEVGDQVVRVLDPQR
jgi:hypothetical protein